jgi:uncharacterized membrane protein YeaQ/YmgE (transglycosylase-associated protein family)
MGILTWIVLGLIAGWLAGRFMRGGYGLVGDIVSWASAAPLLPVTLVVSSSGVI